MLNLEKFLKFCKNIEISRNKIGKNLKWEEFINLTSIMIRKLNLKIRNKELEIWKLGRKLIDTMKVCHCDEISST